MATEFTSLFLFCGIGGGARGFLDAAVSLLGHDAKFRSLGGIDFDDASCRDFVYLTDSPALCADIATMTPAQLREFAGPESPDVVFMSPPCKGFSGLLSEASSKSPKYQAMNSLVMRSVKLLIEAWPDAPPGMILLENVPRIESRGKAFLREVRRLLRGAGYVLSAETHDCGELGGLGQHRRRYLLVARLPKRVSPLLYKPPSKRVRGCGEILGPLPLPNDPVGGPMHVMPRLSLLNWIRLALIPAGGDWRDLEGVLRDGQPRREVFRRHRVEAWGETCATVGGPGSNGPQAVADPRLELDSGFGHTMSVTPWTEPAGTVTHSPSPSSGALAVADPRLGFGYKAHRGTSRVGKWDEPVGTITSQSGRVGHCSPGAVADPRIVPASLGEHAGKMRVEDWTAPAHTVTGSDRVGSGAPSVADPRLLGQLLVRVAYDHGYGVLHFAEPSPTIAGGSHPGQGAYSIADLRVGAVIHSGRFGVLHDDGFDVVDPRKAPPVPVVIVAADGTWHRPLTTLELAALQGFPVVWKGAPLQLHGRSVTGWRERIGNAVPPPTARAIAERMLVALVQAKAGTWSLSSSGDVWVRPQLEEARAC